MNPTHILTALGALAHIDHFFMWRLDWDAAEGKYQKHPVSYVGQEGPPWMSPKDPANWRSAAAVMADLQTAPRGGQTCYTLGFYLTEDLGFWFLDVDKCVVDGQINPLGLEMFGRFPGAFFEYSTSGRGIHLIGRGVPPLHRKKNVPYDLEFYSDVRGIAFNLSDLAYGCADVDHAAALPALVDAWFPPGDAELNTEVNDKPRADWQGPTDDDELLRRALESRSVAAKMGAKASFADLWQNNVPVLQRDYGDKDGKVGNEADAALAAHLAFWTGCDAPRMHRLMRRSALARPKWDEHRTYLKLTIDSACAKQRDVYKEPARRDAAAEMYGMPTLPVLPAMDGSAPAVVEERISDDMRKIVDTLLDMVNTSPDFYDMHNRVIPAIAATLLPDALLPLLENPVKKRLELWNAGMPIKKLRLLLSPPRVTKEDVTGKPAWANGYVFDLLNEQFFDLNDGQGYSRLSFDAQYNRVMPFKESGTRESAAQACLERWDMPVVKSTMYYPGRPAIFDFEGSNWGNKYAPNSVPDTASEIGPAAAAGIQAFQLHLWHLVGQRETIYYTMLYWLAHNVQRPGVKIRWLPLITGVEGAGKSLFSALLQSTMGYRNVGVHGPNNLANGGKFTDWAHGHAVATLEEIYMSGKERYSIYNALKEYITNNVISINPKNEKPKQVVNTQNYIAYSNHTNGVPISPTDRRWLVIAAPYGTLEEMRLQLGMSPQAVSAHFDIMFNTMRECPGEWRKWLVDMPIPDTFDITGSAIWTEEKGAMAATGSDEVELLVQDLIAQGAYGVCPDVFSAPLMRTLVQNTAISQGVEYKSSMLSHIFSRLGFSSMPNPVMWEGKQHRMWAKPKVRDGAIARSLLDATKPSQQ